MAEAGLVAAGKEAGARWAAVGRGYVAAGAADAGGSKGVDVGCGNVLAAVDADVGVAEVVGEDDEDVGSRHVLGRGRGGREGYCEERDRQKVKKSLHIGRPESNGEMSAARENITGIGEDEILYERVSG